MPAVLCRLQHPSCVHGAAWVDEETAVIDVDAMANTAFVGVNRAWLFMGLGVNCANDPQSVNFNLPDSDYLRLLPDELPEAEMLEAKAEFGIWIVSNGLRELIDTFDVFLGQVYAAALTVEAWSAARAGLDVDSGSMQRRAQAFSRLGTEKRLARLDRDFEITGEYTADVNSMRRARNCLTHRLGVVGPEDVGRDGFLALHWHTLELFGINKDGSEFVPSLDDLPIKFPEASPVNMRHVPRERRLFLGERLVLAPGELKHICYTFRLGIDQVRLSFVAYAERMGVQNIKPSHQPTADIAST